MKNDDQTLWSRFYRPCLLIGSDLEKYHLFYGVITEDNKWYISYSHGDSLSALKGITEVDQEKMVQLVDEVYTEKTTIDIIKELYNDVRNSFKPEILIASLLFAVIHKLIIRKKGRLADLLVCLASIIVCVLFSVVIFKPVDLMSFLPVIIAGIIEGVSVHGVAIAIYRLIWK